MAETFVIAESVEFSAVDEDESYLLDLHSKSFFGLNSTGTFVAGLLRRGCALEELVDRTSENFSVERAVCERDVRTFLGELVRRGLVVRG